MSIQRAFLPFAAAGLAAALSNCAAPTTQMVAPTQEAVAKEAEVQKDLIRTNMAVLPKAGERVSVNPEIRTFAIGNRVLIGGAEFCGERVRMTMPFGVRAEGDGVFNVLWAVNVDAAGPGPQFGDTLKVFDGKPVASGRRAGRDLAAAMTEAAKANRTVRLSVERAGQPMEFDVPTVKSCDFYIEYGESDVKNAFADGDKIYITKGIVRLMGDDHELAFVISHELAHNAMDHIGSKKSNMVLGALLGAVLDAAAAAEGETNDGSMMKLGAGMGADSYSQNFKSEADYVGAYIMARAGFDYEAAPDALRRLADKDTIKSEWGQSHPSTPERATASELVVSEITAKAAAGQPLLPTIKEKPVKAAKPKKK